MFAIMVIQILEGKQMTQTSPAISVIMGVYNPESKEKTYRAINSILEQTFGDLEFIIFDDGSDPEIAKEAEAVGRLDPRIRLAGEEKNHGLAYSLNECIKLARGRYIARMDADDYSLPDRFMVQYQFLEANPEYQWCGCNVQLFDDRGVWGEIRYPEEPKKEDFLRFSPFAHPTVMFRREVFEDGNAYRVSAETFRCEDYELFMRLNQKGYRGYNIQQPLFQYRDERTTLKKQKMRFRVNETKVRYKNFKKMGLLNLKGWIYVFRPVAGGFVPSRLIAKVKRREYQHD